MSNADLEFERYRQSLRNPFPPPDRRYRLARRYVADGVSPSCFRDDKEIWEIFKFLRAKQKKARAWSAE